MLTRSLLVFVFILSCGKTQTVTGARGAAGASGAAGAHGAAGADGPLDNTTPDAPTGIRLTAAASGPPSYVLNWALPSGALGAVNVYAALATIDAASKPNPAAVAGRATSAIVQLPVNSGVHHFAVAGVSDTGVEGALSRELVIDTTLEVFVENGTANLFGTFLVDESGQGPLALSALTVGVAAPLESRLSPDGSGLGFLIKDGASLYELYNVDAAGGTALELSQASEGGVRGYAWSPDSQALAYVAGTLGALIVAAPDGSKKVSLPAPAGGAFRQATWSPDGKWFACLVRTATPQNQLFLIAADGTTSVRLDAPSATSPDTANNTGMAWLPDSQSLVFSEDDGRLWRTYVTASAPAIQINGASTLASSSGTMPFALSPGGERVAVRVDGVTDSEVWVGPSAGGVFEHLSSLATAGAQLLWSSDGEHLAFTYDDAGTGTTGVVLADAGGVAQSYAKAGCSVSFIVLAPDSKHFATSCGSETDMFEVGVNAPVGVIANGNVFSWSPDGSMLAWWSGGANFGYAFFDSGNVVEVSSVSATLNNAFFSSFGVPTLTTVYAGG